MTDRQTRILSACTNAPLAVYAVGRYEVSAGGQLIQAIRAASLSPRMEIPRTWRLLICKQSRRRHPIPPLQGNRASAESGWRRRHPLL